MNPKILRHLRSQINPYRRFSVEVIEGDLVRYTCRTCGHSRTKHFGNRGKSHRVKVAPDLVRKLVAYQNNGSGATGHCPNCTRLARDQRWPLPATNKHER